MDTSPTNYKKSGLARLIATNLAILGLLLVAIEGLASYGVVVRSIVTTRGIAERRHTRYDPVLGWSNEPNVFIRDMYGPGLYLRTNAQGFRNNQNISVTIPTGKVRIVCSGDSFTLGYGVDNDHTWCSLLSSLEPRFETVNMGQGGYGVDQAYLWYKRDGAKFNHHVHLLAFITGDFSRMKYDSFLGYGKPVLDIEKGMLVVKNVPVPRRNYYFPWIQHLRQLHTVEFLNRVSRRIGLATADSSQVAQTRDEQIREILHRMFEDLKSLNEQRSSKLVLVYLPDLGAVTSDGPREWTKFLEEESRSLSQFRSSTSSLSFDCLPHEQVVQLFISGDQSGIGHFNEAGNALVAKLIHQKLMTYPFVN